MLGITKHSIRRGGVIQSGPLTLEDVSSGLIVYTIVSSIPLDPTDLSIRLLDGSGPGFLDGASLAVGNTQQDWQTVMFAQAEVFGTNNSIVPNPLGLLTTISRHQSGSLEATAADTLFVMRMVVSLDNWAGDQTTLLIPPARVVLPGSMNQEPDLEYMMRLKRSLELANQV